MTAAFDNNTGVTVSHSGDGYWYRGWKREVVFSRLIAAFDNNTGHRVPLRGRVLV